MKTPHCWDTVLVQKLALLVLGLALALTFATVARAETLSDYQPRSLIDAEVALEQGQPERALGALDEADALLAAAANAGFDADSIRVSVSQDGVPE